MIKRSILCAFAFASLLDASTARADLIPESERRTLTHNVLAGFWGRAKDSGGNPIQPSDEKDRQTVPIDQKEVTRALDAGEVSGVAEWCGLDWKPNYLALTESARRKRFNDKQVAFVSVLHGAAQGTVLSKMAQKKCEPAVKAKIQEALERAGTS